MSPSPFVVGQKLCIVIGLGRGGIGNALAEVFSHRQYNVAMVARSNLQHLESSIPHSKSYPCDAGNPQQVQATVQQILQDTQGDCIDHVMYNVGSGVFKTFESTSYEEFEASWRVGPAGLFLWMKTCLPYLQKSSAPSVGVTGATASWRGMPYTPAFASSKMATRGLVQALARDLGPKHKIHMFHVIIDGLIDLDPEKRKAEGTKQDNQVLDPMAVAKTYFDLAHQPTNCWTQEIHLAAQGAFGDIASI